jgi:hypothetical protein
MVGWSVNDEKDLGKLWVGLISGKKESYPCKRPWRPMGLPHFPHIGSQTAVNLSALRAGHPLLPWKIPGRPQGHSEAGRTIVNFDDLIGNRTLHLLACNVVPQQTKLPRAPLNFWYYHNIFVKAQGKTRRTSLGTDGGAREQNWTSPEYMWEVLWLEPTCSADARDTVLRSKTPLSWCSQFWATSITGIHFFK